MKKLIIIGSAWSNELVDYYDKSSEIWATGSCVYYNDIPRLDVLFELHKYSDVKQLMVKGDYNRFKCKVYVQSKKIAGLFDHECIVYPLDEIKELTGENYFTSTFAYMLALAIYQGYKEIHIKKANLSVGSEYEYQRPCLEYLIGLARGKGINVYVSKESDILSSSYLYGYQDQPIGEEKLKARKAFVKHQLVKCLQEYENQIALGYQYSGMKGVIEKVNAGNMTAEEKKRILDTSKDIILDSFKKANELKIDINRLLEAMETHNYYCQLLEA
jgi:hypothetical protein